MSGIVKGSDPAADGLITIGGPAGPHPMLTETSINARIEALAERKLRFSPDAYHFVFQALDFVLEREDRMVVDAGERLAADRHISAPQLLDGLRAFALDQYGPLARLVLERWGVCTTEDFGEIVFDLVDGRLLNKQESDRLEDFRNGFNFREAFDKAWRTGRPARA